jgi:peptidoglycan/xylan/chitin deacetylase (PgdA/CDA1 family)
MGTPGVLYLMYHELEMERRGLCRSEAGYVRYVVRQAAFEHHLEAIRSNGLRGISVGEALNCRKDQAGAVAITFDDGSESDLLAAAPALRGLGFNCTFYLVSGFLGRSGYLSAPQARELADLGFEVGCHSMTHLFLTDLQEPELRHEIVDAKRELEQVVGRSVKHFSCPGGRWNRRVAELAHKVGYESVACSQIGRNNLTSDRFRLARVPVYRDTSSAEIVRWCKGKGLLSKQAWQSFRSMAARAVGNSAYDRIRKGFLGR